MNLLFANEAGLGEVFHALGVNIPALCFDASAFLIFTWFLGKYVFPILNQAIDHKRAELVATSQFKLEAEARLLAADTKAKDIIASARHTADEAISSAQTEATQIIKLARDKATQQTARMLAAASEQLTQDVARAKLELKLDLARLVAAETEHLLGSELSSTVDMKLINQSLAERGIQS